MSINFNTSYLGFKLNNPIIVSSSGLTKNLDNLISLEKAGAGAVVLKSLFEEQIRYEVSASVDEIGQGQLYPEADDYIRNYAMHNHLDVYLKLISDAKKSLSIPVIASVNCTSTNQWISFAKKIEDAGADALELNILVLPSDTNLDAEQVEQTHFDIIRAVKKEVSIPIAVKMGSNFSGLAKFITKLSWEGIQGLVLFNRFYSPDFDLNTFEVISANMLSTPHEISTSLRWTALMSGRVNCDIASSTGVHDGNGVVKQILAGAKAVQICSTIYKNGFEIISSMKDNLNDFMIKHNYKGIEDFRGKMSFDKAVNPAAFERVQFMKHYAKID